MKDFFMELKERIIKYKMNIIKTILDIFSYSCILTIIGLKGSYNIFLLLGCFAIIFMFLKVDINKKMNKISILIAIIVSFVISLGNIVETSISTNTLNIFSLKTLAELFITFGGIFIFLYFLFNFIFSKLKTVNLLSKNDRNSANKIFFVSWGLIFILWIPYFLRFFPGIMTLDSQVQLFYIEEGVFRNNHPFVQTWFEGGIYHLGKIIFNNTTIAMGFYTLVQMLILSAIFAYAVRFLYKHKFNSIIVILVLLAYALLPQFTLYSVTVWKDVLFGGAFLLLLISVVEMTLSDKLNKANVILFIISLLMILFFRNNGVYVLLLCVPFFIYCFRKKLKIILPILLSLFAIYFIVTGPVYNYLKVEKPSSVESLAIPLQQVGRVIATSDEMSKKEKNYLETIFNFEEIKEVYSPIIVDPVKNHADKQELEETKNEFFTTWWTLLLKHPDTYIEAYLTQTLGYWYPSVKYWTIGTLYAENDYDIHYVNILPDFLTKIIDNTKSNNYSLSTLCWGIGLGFLLLFLSFIVAHIRNIDKSKYLAWFIPFVGLWVTMMIASPVYAEYRYVYGLFTSLPIIVLIPFIINFSKKKQKK